MTADPRTGGLCWLCGRLVNDPDNAVSRTEHRVCPEPYRRYHDAPTRGAREYPQRVNMDPVAARRLGRPIEDVELPERPW